MHFIVGALCNVVYMFKFAFPRISLDIVSRRRMMDHAVVVEHVAQVPGSRSMLWGVRASLWRVIPLAGAPDLLVP